MAKRRSRPTSQPSSATFPVEDRPCPHEEQRQAGHDEKETREIDIGAKCLKEKDKILDTEKMLLRDAVRCRPRAVAVVQQISEDRSAVGHEPQSGGKHRERKRGCQGEKTLLPVVLRREDLHQSSRNEGWNKGDRHGAGKRQQPKRHAENQ